MRALSDATAASAVRELGRAGFLFDQADAFALRGLAFAGASGCADPTWQRAEVPRAVERVCSGRLCVCVGQRKSARWVGNMLPRNAYKP